MQISTAVFGLFAFGAALRLLVVGAITIGIIVLDAVLALLSAALEAGAADIGPIISRLGATIGGLFSLGTAASLAKETQTLRTTRHLLSIHSTPIPIINNALAGTYRSGNGTAFHAYAADETIGGVSEQMPKIGTTGPCLIGAFRGQNHHHGQTRGTHPFKLIESFPTHPHMVGLHEWFVSETLRTCLKFRLFSLQIYQYWHGSTCTSHKSAILPPNPERTYLHLWSSNDGK